MTSAPRLSLQELRSQIPYLPRTLKLVWNAGGNWTLAWALLLLVQGVLPLAPVYLTKAVVDALVQALRSGGDWLAVRPVVLWGALMAGILLVSELLGGLSQWLRTTQADMIQDYVSGLIQAKAVALDLAFYETPEYYDRLFRARVDAVSRPVLLLENLGALAQNGITLTAMAGVLFSYSWWLPLVLIFGTLPALWVVGRATLRQARWRQRHTARERRSRYYDWLLTMPENAAELRLYDLGRYYRQAFAQLRQQLRLEKQALGLEQLWGQVSASAFAFLTGGAAIVWVIWGAVKGRASLGDVALFYQVFNQGQRLMQTLLGNVGEIYRNLLFLENLFEFLQLEPHIVSPPQPLPLSSHLQKGIGFAGVTFHYPGNARPALDNFSLDIPAGRIIALVGDNGAGKSTLIKLLCRFYDPTAGRISADGLDLRDLDLDKWRRRITVLFQEPVRYHATAADNVAQGDLDACPTREEIEQVARAAGAHAPIMKLPQGYETLLGRWFGGVDLSVGEWQRLALARAFLRQADILVLDEPTSAMDSWAEADWLARFRALTKGHTVLIITHRFTTAMQADIIHVMEAGRIIESGTHTELVQRGGRYGQSWEQQMQRGKDKATGPATNRQS
jgi:ATP-binding cassette, subfamily B, bacterial